jgi:MYXO-CTERM domain-containing protein
MTRRDMRLAPALALAFAPLAAVAVTLNVNGSNLDVLVGRDNCKTLQLVANWDLGVGAPTGTDTVQVMGVRNPATCSDANPVVQVSLVSKQAPTAQTGSANTTANALALADADAGTPGCDNPDIVARRSASPITNVLCVQYANAGAISVASVNVKYALTPPLAPANVSITPGDSHLKISWVQGDAADDIATFDVHVWPAGTTPDGGVAQNKVTSLKADVDRTDDNQPLQNDAGYLVTVVAHDKYGNVSDPSTEQTAFPVATSDFYNHYRDAGGTALGGCASGNDAAWIAGGAALMALLLRRRRKARNGAALIALFALLAPAARAEDSSPRFLIGFKMDRYDPKVDSEPGLTIHPYHEIFGTRAPPRYQLEFDWEVAHPFGAILVGVTAGFWQNYGKALLASSTLGNPQRSEDTTVLNIFPFGLIATYRFDWLANRWQRFPVIPYAQAGLMRALWVSYNGRGNVSSDPSGGGRGRGWTNGYTTALGFALTLNALDPELSREAYIDTGIQRTSLFAEYGWTYLSNFHKTGALILSDHAWRFGLAVEF